MDKILESWLGFGSINYHRKGPSGIYHSSHLNLGGTACLWPFQKALPKTSVQRSQKKLKRKGGSHTGLIKKVLATHTFQLKTTVFFEINLFQVKEVK